jgi:hypothetical protein
VDADGLQPLKKRNHWLQKESWLSWEFKVSTRLKITQ